MKPALMGLATLLGGFLGLSHAARAQGNYVDDALLFSRQNPAGTARTLGLAGATTALGGDYGSMNTNPAGLGLYTKSEISFTPGVGIGSARSTPVANAASSLQLGTQQSANSFHVASLGLVFTTRRADGDQSSAWRGGSFALGFTRLADFNYGFRYRNTVDDRYSFYQFLREPGGYAQNQVFTQGYQSAADNIYQQDQTGDYVDLDGLAYGNFLTNQTPVYDSQGNKYFQITIAHPRTGAVQQDEVQRSEGSLSQFDIGYGGNYRDRLYIGGAVGIVSMNRTRTSTFSESQNGVENFHYDDYLRTTGSGINARLGIIVKAADALRFGLSAQTPTYIRLSDEYSTTLTVNQSYVTGGNASGNVLSTTPGVYDYGVTLPFRANGGLTVLLSKYGFLTGDVEYVGYSQTRFRASDNDNTSEIPNSNQAISAGYRNTFNYKAGIEGRFDIFRVRLGYAYYSNPYAGGSLGRGQNYITGGVGIRNKSFFLDLSEVYVSNKDQYSPYGLATTVSPAININANRATTSLTGGFIF